MRTTEFSGPAVDRTMRPAGSMQKARRVYLAAAGVSLTLSVSLWFTGHTDEGLFVGLWVLTILSAGNLVLDRRVDH